MYFLIAMVFVVLGSAAKSFVSSIEIYKYTVLQDDAFLNVNDVMNVNI